MKIKRRQIFFTVLFTIVIGIFTSSSLAVITVRPLSIQLLAKPGETVPFVVEVVSQEKVVEPVNLKILRPVQKTNGDFSFQEEDVKVFPELQWINMERTNFLLRPGEVSTFKGNVKVPFNARGTHLYAIMIEPLLKQGSSSIDVFVRYAVLVRLNIDAAGSRPNAQIKGLQLVKGKNGEPQIQMSAYNSSLWDFNTSAFATIRDNTSKRLIDRVELRTQLGWLGEQNETRMFPGSTLEYYGIPSKALTPGDYEIRIFYRYASSGQILMTKNVQVKLGDYIYSPGKLKKVIINPEGLSLEGRPGSGNMKGLKFENRFSQPVKVQIDPVDVENNYPYSVITNTVLEFKPGKELILEPGRIGIIVVNAKFPKSASIQGNYGSLKVKVISLDSKPLVLEESVIDLEAKVIGKYKYIVEATTISGDKNDSNYLVSAVINNKGNIKIFPYAEVIFKDQNDNFVGATKLTVVEGEKNSVLPGKLITLVGNIDMLKPGSYKAEIKIFNESLEVGVTKLNLDVK